jgi:hypothetical protein
MTRLVVTGRRIFLAEPEDVPGIVRDAGCALVTIHPPVAPDGEAPGEDIITAAAERAITYARVGERPPAWLEDGIKLAHDLPAYPDPAPHLPFRIPSFSSVAQGPAADRGAA